MPTPPPPWSLRHFVRHFVTVPTPLWGGELSQHRGVRMVSDNHHVDNILAGPLGSNEGRGFGEG